MERPGRHIRSINPPTTKQAAFASDLGIPEEAVLGSTREELAGRIETALNQEPLKRRKRALIGIVPGARVKRISNWDQLDPEELERRMADPESQEYTVRRIHNKQIFLEERPGLFQPWNLKLVSEEKQKGS